MEYDLSSEEEANLKELVDAEEGGRDAADLIDHRLYNELSHIKERTDYGTVVREYDPGYADQRQIYESLAEKGYIRTLGGFRGSCRFEGLTSKGRCYFRDKAALEEKEREALSESRRHDYKVASYGAIAGGVLGLFSGAFASDVMAWVRDLIQNMPQ